MRILDIKKWGKWSVLAALLAGNGCHNSGTQSATNSLDNFARKEAMPVVKHQCSGDNEVLAGLKAEDDGIEFGSEVSSTTQSDLKHAVKTSLSAVPTNLQLLFFGLGGKIVITHEADSICNQYLDSTVKKTFASEGESAIKSCWQLDEGLLAQRITDIHNYTGDGEAEPSLDGTPITIYLNADTVDIRHSTVRIFAYILSQVLASIDQKAGSDAVTIGAANEDFRAAQKSLSSALRSDVKASSAYDLSIYSKLASVDKQAFNDYVFAEAFDSYYCSDETRDVMTTDFAKTKARFKMIAAEIETLEISDQDLVEGGEGTESAALTAAYSNGYGLRLFGGLFLGAGRLAFGIARFAGRVIIGAAQVAARVVDGILTVGAHLIRGAVDLAAGIIRGVVVVAGRIVQGIARGVVGVVRVILDPYLWTNIAWDANVVFGFPRMDNDVDGITNALDHCSGTPVNSAIWESGEWTGCAGGETSWAYDSDGDSIVDAYDLCSATPTGAAVWDDGLYTGCAGGEYADRVYEGN